MLLLINLFSDEFFKRSFSFILEFNVCPSSFAAKAIYVFLVILFSIIISTYIISVKYYCESKKSFKKMFELNYKDTRTRFSAFILKVETSSNEQ